MFNNQEFSKIRSDLVKFENEREIEISKARDIIRLSKLIINSLHREDIKCASSHVMDIRRKVKNLSRKNYDMSISSVALQEYAEALSYYYFITKGRLPTRKEISIDTESYLLGLCDLTGELVRKAVDCAIRKRFKEVISIKNIVSEIYNAFLHFTLRNGELRKKTDSIKYNLVKLEDLVYKIGQK